MSHIRYNGRQVYHPRKVQAGRRERSEYKKCENEPAAGEQEGTREIAATRNCQNELPAHSAPLPFAAHETGRIGSASPSGKIGGEKHPKEVRLRVPLLWYTVGIEFKQYQEGSHVGTDDDSQG